MEVEESAGTAVAVVAGIATTTMMTIWTRVANRGVLRVHFVLLDEETEGVDGQGSTYV